MAGSNTTTSQRNGLITFQINLDVDQLRSIIREELQAAGTVSCNPSTNSDKPITTKELCEHLRLSKPTILRYRRKNKIPFFYIGSAIRFNLQDVKKSLEK
ncbi:helix-turn-helix domain-containing protein [Ferruginibacter paludis]|uniref:helix-turn-helix domain-containing protein n=1 Tax=Ferruginibacter paludis TaxID=1310417 RepID=UPI0025B38F14|nr:helix-turn-helix domain-containing protein [Ferruginibacter paludis]MDN3658920.1 helix-turn-helix domain-containing protein [Ferruginibacter paludis]